MLQFYTLADDQVHLMQSKDLILNYHFHFGKHIEHAGVLAFCSYDFKPLAVVSISIV